jgi:hypothetical protein
LSSSTRKYCRVSSIQHHHTRPWTYFIVHGPPSSDKTSFIAALFREAENFTPLVTPSSRYFTADAIVNQIALQTNRISELQIAISQVRQFAFIFENAEATHTGTIEFPRMLLCTGRIPLFSTGDAKV